MLSAVTANLGRHTVGMTWVRQVLGRTGPVAVDLLFLQELPQIDDWTALAGSHAFRIVVDAESGYQVRSAVLWREATIAAEPFPLATRGYHGSYLAAVKLELPGAGHTVAVSVHASPCIVEAHDLETWVAQGLPLPDPRLSANHGERWDSDLVLATLGDLNRAHAVLAAGDFNECLAWDETHPGEWGREYFERVEAAGLVSLTHRNGGTETQTAFTHDHLAYQLDHVIASPAVADRIPGAPQVEAGWSRRRVLAGEVSDHAPLWFTISEP